MTEILLKVALKHHQTNILEVLLTSTHLWVIHVIFLFFLIMQSVPITTKVVSLNPAHGKVYSIQLYVIKFVIKLQQVCGFLRVLQFPPQIKLAATI
jgi:hypothetical protein